MPATQQEVVLEKRRRELKSLRREFMQTSLGKRVRAPSEVETIDVMLMHLESGAVKKKKIEFVRKCPMTECLGFLNKNWFCDLCSAAICQKCNECIRGDCHECDPNAVETMKTLAKDTRPCPKCGTMIYKSSGCSQMWCVDCHTTFDWNTMRIETDAVIHNPHYYAYRREHGGMPRQPGDNPCGNDGIHIGELIMAQVASAEVFGMHRILQHIRMYLRNMGGPTEHDRDPNRKIRFMYMVGDITEQQFRSRITSTEKAREKHRDIVDVLQMFLDAGEDIMRKVMDSKDMVAFRKERDWLFRYTNDALDWIRDTYKSKVLLIKVNDTKTHFEVHP